MNISNNKMARNPLRYPFAFTVPALLVYTIIFVLPTISGFYYAFTDWNGSSVDIKFIGIKQFFEAVNNPDFSRAMFNTTIFAVTITVFKNLFALVLALALNTKIHSRNTLRALYFSPTIMNVVAMGLIFQGLLNPYTGFVNNTLRALNLNFLALGWISDPNLAIYCCGGMEIWRATGISMAIYLAGLQGINRDYYEAATIDGANAWQRFKDVTLPLLWSSVTINVILCLIYGFRMFECVYYLTQGGPGTASEVMMTLAYKYMGMGLFGYSAAINVILFIFILVICIPVLIWLRKGEVE